MQKIEYRMTIKMGGMVMGAVLLLLGAMKLMLP